MIQFLAAGGSVPPFFILLTLVLSSVVVVSLILSKFKQSLLVGYFLCGLIIANSGVLDYLRVDNEQYIHALSEVGIVLLLFTLGIEFSITELKKLRKAVFIGGFVQVCFTLLLSGVISYSLGFSASYSFIIGSIIALSSTAVSVKSFQNMEISESPPARTTLGIAIFQDLAAILFMILIPVLAGQSDQQDSSILSAILKGAGFAIAIVVLSRKGFPQMLDAVAHTRSRELFTITVVGLCAVVALISGLLGLSPALGAFAAGVIVSESIYSHRVLSDILPFKDLFLTVFFVSVGLMIDIETLQNHWLAITALTSAILIFKGLIAALAAKLSGLSTKNAIVTATSLASTGEFSIVLLNHSNSFNILTPEWGQTLLASTAISMGLLPTLMKFSTKLSQQLRPNLNKTDAELKEDFSTLEDHVIICGYGPVGKNLHTSLTKSKIQSIIIEMNPDTVKKLHKKGVKALYADITDAETLKLAHLHTARALVITFPNKSTALSTLHSARNINPSIQLFTRSKFATEAQELHRLGFDHILLDEELSGKAMIQSVMQCFDAEFDEHWF